MRFVRLKKKKNELVKRRKSTIKLKTKEFNRGIEDNNVIISNKSEAAVTLRNIADNVEQG